MVIQVLVNLIKNAIEALDESLRPERVIWIETRLDRRPEGDFVVCVIRDNGPGFSDEVRSRLFDFGYTTKRHTKGGQGVGLHFCRKTLEKMLGSLEASSHSDGGAVFTICLPCGSPPV